MTNKQQLGVNKVPSDYKVPARVYELAQENNIPQSYVDKQVSEFIFYFQEKNTRRKSWDRSFWNWIKNGWSWKKQKEQKTSPQAYIETEMEDIQVSSRETARAHLMKLRRFEA